MKWVRFSDEHTEQYGLLDGSTIKQTQHQWADVLQGAEPTVIGEIAFEKVELLSPVERPGKIVAIGLNYLDHCRETNTPPPEKPLVFTKFTTSLNHPNKAIAWSDTLTNEVDFEAELAVVIGKTARRVTEAKALDYVFGYTAANDVSARDIQLGDGQWVRGKSLDTFCPMGPVLVTADEIPNPQTLSIKCTLNGMVVQDSSTSEMIFSVAKLVSFCSDAFTLEPGDVILTGTPHGVGLSREPKLYMTNGDKVSVEIESIGQLSNFCVIE